MNIIVTIKSILNYLYNNLINLVWVKKIKFSDGTEMTTAGNSGGSFNLFDIKLSAQLIAEKGFAFLCKTVRDDLSKDKCPTMYNVILNKYNNAEFDISGSIVDNINNSYSSMYVKYNKYTNEFVGFIDGNFYKADNKDFNNKTQITLQRAGLFYLGQNINFVMDNYSSWIDIYNTDWEFVKTIDISQFYNWIITANERSFYNNNSFVFGLSSTDGNIQKYYKLYINDINVNSQTPDTDIINIEIIVDRQLQSIWTDGTYTTTCQQASDGFDGHVKPMIIKIVEDDIAYCETTFCNLNIGNPQEKENNIVCGVNGIVLDYPSNKVPYDSSSLIDSYNYVGFNGNNAHLDGNVTNSINKQFYATIVDYNNNVSLALFEKRKFKLSLTNYDNSNHYTFNCYYPIKKIINYDYSTMGTCLKYISKNLILLQKGLYRINGTILEAVFEFSSKVSDNAGNIDYCNIIDNNLFVLSCDNHYYYVNLQQKQFSDTYVVDGNTVTINYYKNGDFKICLADNTNDNNLETIYNYFGYCNYYRLDLNNETISLIRNSNLYTAMYIGDNFIDDTINIFGLSTRLLPQPLEIITDNTSISVDLKENTNYKFINSAITDITINSCQDSNLDIYIKFTTGNSAPTLTDNSGIVWTDGQPVLQANKTYVIVIVNKTAYYKEF